MLGEEKTDKLTEVEQISYDRTQFNPYDPKLIKRHFERSRNIMVESEHNLARLVAQEQKVMEENDRKARLERFK